MWLDVEHFERYSKIRRWIPTTLHMPQTSPHADPLSMFVPWGSAQKWQLLQIAKCAWGKHMHVFASGICGRADVLKSNLGRIEADNVKPRFCHRLDTPSPSSYSNERIAKHRGIILN